MPSIQPRPLLLFGVGNNSIDNSSDNESDTSERTTCNSSPPSKQPELLVPPTSETIPANDANAAAAAANDDDAKGSEEVGESEDGTAFEVSISGIHADSTNDSNNNQAPADHATTTTTTTNENSNALVPPPTPPPTLVTDSKTKDSPPKTKHSVVFDPFSTLYVFNDDSDGEEEKYNIRNAWYSAQDLKSFRADAFLTVNWIVMKGVDPSSSTGNASPEEQPRKSNGQHNQRPHKSEYSWYSKKYGYGRKKKVEKINDATLKGYEFCERGVECRTPLGRIAKSKRRQDALRVVLLYQQMQRRDRRERRRDLRRQKQQEQQNRSDRNKNTQLSCIRYRKTPDPEAVLRNEANIDAEALAMVYGNYCEESLSEAFAMGQADASFAGISTAASYLTDYDTDDTSSPETGKEASLLDHPCDSSCEELSQASKDFTRAQSAPNHFTKGEIVNCPSLCDDDDDEEFMDKLVTLSFADHSDDDESDEESLVLDHSATIFDSKRSQSEDSLIRGTADDNDSFGSDSSLSLGGIFFEQNKGNSSQQEQASESEIEVELLEGDDDHPHKVSCYSERPSSTKHHRRSNPLVRRNSWSHEDQKSGPSSLEFGGLFSVAAFWRR